MSVFYGKRGKTRRLIMQNSKALLETHGIEHVTMQDIADAANVSYDSEDDIENIIDKAECDLELINSQTYGVKNALSELRKMRNTRIEEQGGVKDEMDRVITER